MFAKTVFVFCAQAVFIQAVFCQFANRAAIEAGLAPCGLAGPGIAASMAGLGLGYNGLAGPALAYDGIPNWAGGFAPAMEFTATSGGALPVTSMSAIAPTGISVVSENAFEGVLSVAGELPFVGTTGMEGALPSAGAGAINHACGNGVNAMVSEGGVVGGAGLAATGIIAPVAASFGPAGFAPAAGFGSAAGFGPAAAAYGPAFAGRLGAGDCGRNIV